MDRVKVICGDSYTTAWDSLRIMMRTRRKSGPLLEYNNVILKSNSIMLVNTLDNVM